NTVGPIILGGDFNFREPFTFEKDITERLIYSCTENTFPSWKPEFELDYLFLSREFEVIKKYTPSSPAFSDHLPLIVEAEF
ncbi:MAG TPA: endonuclease, partial [Candidatus Paceibacterota bacterium]|nr:endonuclease [Candidatus Paceibacterota bacterium]